MPTATTSMSEASEFPKGKAKARLWAEMQAQFPELLSLMNTLKDQGYTSKVTYYANESGSFSSDEFPIPESQLWQIDDATVERAAASHRAAQPVIKAKGKKK